MTITGTSIASLGEALAANRTEGTRADLPLHRIGSAMDAEYVQDVAVMALDDNIVGYVATATNPATQRRLQCDTPVIGPLVSSVMLSDPARFHLQYGVLGAECSLGFIVGAPYPDPHTEVSGEALGEIIIGCMPMITILGRRVPQTVPLNAWTATADFGLHAASVKGAAVFDRRLDDLLKADLVASMNDAVMGRSGGESVGDEVMTAMLWLANALRRRGRQLSPGHILAIGRGPLIMQAVAGQTFRTDFGDLGSVEVAFD